MRGPRVIAHVDLDAFYASVEVRDRPELKGRPVIVAGAPPRGVVCAASYEARKFGVRSAIPTVTALRLCPEAVLLPVRIGHYAAESDRFFEILSRYSPLVEGLSLDEAFLDLTGTEALLGPPVEAVRRLRGEVRDRLGLPASAGIAPTKLAAKIATDLAKPDGQLEVRAEGLRAFLEPLPVGRIFGVGPRREEQLRRIGVRTIGELRDVSLPLLRRAAGADAEGLQALARGEDDREVVADRQAKSIGAEETFDTDLEETEAIETFLLGQSERVAARLRRLGLVATGVTLKYKLRDFRLVTRQRALPPTSDGPTLFAAVRRLLQENPPPLPIRLCGVSAHGLGPPPARGLFDAPAARTERLNEAIDAVREKFGSNALVRARLAGRKPRKQE